MVFSLYPLSGQSIPPTLCSWPILPWYLTYQKKGKVLMSTLHRDGTISSQGDPVKEEHYRSPLVIFYNKLDGSAYNAFMIWMAIKPGWKPKEAPKKTTFFLEELGKALVSLHI
ncbi:hypothetical protein L3Q82_023824 [Scortum barcoo]|uniref:Uncharacterized protein n=1 Tax=Scortum barcoo TaxID=214431 RepID=A0ACB8WTM1_9TELE|nr:hypothetical protein L3Q82_023824 [Scortum barcoo]